MREYSLLRGKTLLKNAQQLLETTTETDLRMALYRAGPRKAEYEPTRESTVLLELVQVDNDFTTRNQVQSSLL